MNDSKRLLWYGFSHIPMVIPLYNLLLMLGREKLIQEHQYLKRKEDVATVEKSPQAVALQL